MQNPQGQMEIKKPFIIFIALKMFTWLSLLIAAIIIYGGDNFVYNFKHALVNWDAIWYLKIAAEGYDIPKKCVFFPLLPVFVRITVLIIRDYAWAGIFLSNLFCFIGSVLFYNLVKEAQTSKTALISLILFLSAPTALFYLNFYPESLFFMLSVAVFYFAHKKQWLAAAITAGLASATRNYGAVLAVPLLWEYFTVKRITPGSLVKASGLALIASLGLILYSVYMYVSYKDPLFFVHSQNLWHGRDKLVMPFTALFTRLSDFPGLFRLNVDPMKTNLNAIYFSAAIALNVYVFKKIKGPDFIYLTVMVVFLSLQPMLMSLSRYISAIFVVWAAAGIFISNRRNSGLWLTGAAAVMLIWQAVINFRWMAGLWVA